MTLVTFIYLIDFLSSLNAAMSVAVGISVFTAVVSAIFVSFAEDTLNAKELKKANRILKCSVAILVFSTLMVCLTPSKNTMYMMGAAVVGEEFIKSDTGQKLQKLVEAKIDRELEEVSKKVDKLQK